MDLETIPDPDIPQPEDPERFPPPGCHRIVCVGALFCTRDFGGMGLTSVCSEDEGDLVQRSIKALSAPNVFRLVGWNSTGFDAPTLVARGLVHGAEWPRLFGERDWRYRYSVDRHWDVKDDLACYQARASMHLDQAARLVGFPGKVGVDGTKVSAMWEAGQRDEIAAYCACDVVHTAAVAMRMQLLKGWSLSVYREAATRLLDLVDTDDRLACLRAGINRERWLLPAKATEEVSI